MNTLTAPRNPRLPVRATLAATLALALAVALAPQAQAYPRPGATERASVGAAGQADDTSSDPSVSADGRYVAFQSRATNLVDRDTGGGWHVYVRDRATGDTRIVSVATDGSVANDTSWTPDISGNGRFVAFESWATNLAPGISEPALRVYRHDLETGETVLASVDANGVPVSPAAKPSISDDGQLVAFERTSGNRVDIWLRDLAASATELVSRTDTGGLSSNPSFSPAISGDGRYVAFHTESFNMVSTQQVPSDVFQVYVRDRQANETRLVSATAEGEPADEHAQGPSISADGRYVSFDSPATNFVPGVTGDRHDVYVKDTGDGAIERVSLTSGGAEGSGSSFLSSISADGRVVAFRSVASELGGGTVGSVYVHDRLSKVTDLVSVSEDGESGNASSQEATLSGDGRTVAFSSDATNLAGDDSNNRRDVFVRDRGPVLGVGQLTAALDGEAVSVAGWATFSGARFETTNDVPSGPAELGIELRGAAITARPEHESLHLRWDVGDLLSHPFGAGLPFVTYQAEFRFRGTLWRVRAHRGQASPDMPEAFFGLYNCGQNLNVGPLQQRICNLTQELDGGMGTGGEAITVSVPFTDLGARSDETISDIEVAIGPGTQSSGPMQAIDTLAIPNLAVSEATVELAIAPAGADEPEAFSAVALSDGRFTGTLDTAGLAPGAHLVWARACLGSTCSVSSTPVTLP